MTLPVRRGLAALALVALALSAVLLVMGRVPWCACGSPIPWSFDVWSRHNSQHLVDPYFGSHVLHGLVFYAALRLLGPGREVARWAIALVVEACWEVLENTPLVIDRYREATMALDYYGDSVANSATDLAACALGYLFAMRLPVWASVALFVGVEVVTAWWIKDGLILNVIMLLWPIDAIRAWQTGG